MRDVDFDPFGEPLAGLPAAKPGRLSGVMLRLGVGLFWTLVAAILVARVMTFNPDFAQTFGAVASALGLGHIAS